MEAREQLSWPEKKKSTKCQRLCCYMILLFSPHWLADQTQKQQLIYSMTTYLVLAIVLLGVA